MKAPEPSQPCNGSQVYWYGANVRTVRFGIYSNGLSGLDRTTFGEGHFTLQEAFEIFQNRRILFGFWKEFPRKQKDFCQKCTRFLGVKCP